MSNSVSSYQDRDAGISPDLVREYVQKVSFKHWQGSALDVGTGAGGWVSRLNKSQKFSKIYSSDLIDCRSEEVKHLDFFKVDLSSELLPLQDHSLDLIFAVEVLEHLENPRRFVREAFRVLKPGGKLVVSTPNCDSFRSRISMLLRGYFPAFCQSDYIGSGHITPITKLDYHRMLKEAGFSSHEDFFGMPGRLPNLRLNWQQLLPFLKGHLWSDCFVNISTK